MTLETTVDGPDGGASPTGTGRSLTSSRGAMADTAFRFALYAAGILVLVVIGAMMVQLFIGGLPAVMAFGFDFFTSTDWDPAPDHEHYGAGIMLYGTLVTSVLALVFSVPASLGIAFFLTEVAPIPSRKPIGIAVQLLAAVPSIIYGMWGFFIVAPIMKDYIQPLLIDGLSWLPVVGELFAGPAKGTGVFTTSLILALMVLPFMTSMYVEVLESVPGVIKEASYGIGSTTWEVFTTVSVPYGRTAIIGATMLGLGRALGETMTVAFVIGNAARISTSLFASGATISSQLANNFNESRVGSLLQASLLELGFTLFVISFLVLALARYLVRSRLQG
ncbi:MAG: phosphate ABC transporter permease subunit PstC [Ancalomicrobiaceae bacterium]|nr:phosphate ABC transporter permease subunit PstC [Ancalomicrobiaceae bacterium]